MKKTSDIELSGEQQLFIEKALQGANILVDACIGSGKTTAIQNLCNELPNNKKVLYLTYNKLLKLDAKSKIHKRNVTVTNYHGFAYMLLQRKGVSVGISDLIQTFIREKPSIGKYDILIIDEYQDIEQELAELLKLIKESNPNIQIIAVGDMEQKIYDKTTLNVESFMKEFLEDYLILKFTQCFRLSKGLASMLGRVWKKQIKGVNSYCQVEEMEQEDVIPFLAEQIPADILCLGARTGAMSDTLNTLEERYPHKFNKKTVYATISDNDSMGKTEPEEAVLSEKTLSTFITANHKFEDLDISEMFDFKYKEDVEKCFSLLKVKKIPSEDDSIINIKSTDDLIDLSPCIGIYQEAVFFENYQIDAAIELKFLLNSELAGLYALYKKAVKDSFLDQKILFLVSLETKQKRYRTQVSTPFVNEEESKLIKARLSTRLNGAEDAQVACQIDFGDRKKQEVMFSAKGFADVVKENIVYELKFVSELTHEHYLQCASYMVAMDLQKGILWNTRDNTSYEIEVPDKKAFLDAVTRAVTKGAMENYYNPGLSWKETEGYKADKFAVVDTETNWNDEVMSIGVVVADSQTKQKIDSAYYIIDPEYRVGGMYSDELRLDAKGVCITDRGQALKEIRQWMDSYHVQKLFAYNASFDKRHLPEYADYEWYDIMRLAAYRQYNRAIQDFADCYRTGKLKYGYSVENILKMLSGNRGYRETHNAVFDAEDELQVMQLLGHELSKYDVALLSDHKISRTGKM